jgi:ABC-2 type transport system ATP-binding protein
MTTAIHAQDLRVVRGAKTVLDHVDFSVTAGSVTGLLGSSGSGKTTLLRTITGVQRNVSGEISVLGMPAGDKALRSQVGYVTQAPSVYADLTVRENMRYFAAVLGVENHAIDGVLETVELLGYADQVVDTLSGGQRSRVSLATALLGDPALLILDEPTVGLDPVLRNELWRTFQGLAARGTTVLVSSHVMDEADRCERILVLRNGRIAVDDTPTGMRDATGCDQLEDAFLALETKEAA